MLEKLKSEMINYYRGDPKRIQHFIKVFFFCDMIGTAEGLSDNDMLVLKAAALTHDIGIKKAEQLYNSTAGKYQEQLGPALAEEMLKNIGFSDDTIERVSFLTAHHHTYNNINAVDYRILIEADFLVNMYEDNLDKDSVKSAYNKIFSTQSGKNICKAMFNL